MTELQTNKLTLLVTSDIHGHILPTNYRDEEEQDCGLAKLSTIIKNKRSEKDNVFLIDNGDIVQGTPLTYYNARFRKGEENPVAKVLNYLQYDAVVFGNHEFNYGLDYLKNIVNQSNFPWLSANIVGDENNEPAFGCPYIIKELSGVKVAVLGMTTAFVPNWENQENIIGLKFQDVMDRAQDWIDYIHELEKPDIFIVSYHGGFERDLQTGIPTENLTGENQAYQLCHALNGMDVLITGHQHRLLSGTVNGVTVIQPGNKGEVLGEIDIELERTDAQWSITSRAVRFSQVSGDDEADLKVVELVADDEKQTQQWLDQSIGTVNGDMRVTDPMQIRMQDHSITEFINTVQMEAAGVDISCTALFDNNSPGLKEKVTMRDIVANYIFPNTLKVLRITGLDLREALEKSASYFSVNESKEIEVALEFREPKQQHYNYDMWEGIEYELNISKPMGHRVTKLIYQGKPVVYDKEYDVVMNNYRAGGGGGYSMFKGKEVVKDITTDMTELIANYMLEHKFIEASCNNNWKVTV